MSHGLAATIRGSTDSETFDLAGLNVATIEKTIQDAFSDPFDLDVMIRLTFITGAGKLGRAKYDDNAAKVLTTVLRDIGYEEDRGASAVIECAGSFKLQHDTGKNLKTVVVFPKLRSKGTHEQNVGNGDKQSNVGSSMLVEGSVNHKLAFAPMNVFQRMMESQCVTWSQKKACVAALGEILLLVQKLDEQLLRGQQLSDSEQELYDSLSATSLEEKTACVRELMQKQIDEGAIVAEEKRLLINQVENKIRELQIEIDQAQAEGKTKRVENLTTAQTKANARKLKLESIVPRPPPKLKNESQILKLSLELKPILQLEESTKGRLLSVKESQEVAKKIEILAQIEELEKSSRGWFETDEFFNNRIKVSQLNRKKSQQAGKKTTPGNTQQKSNGATMSGLSKMTLVSNARNTTSGNTLAPKSFKTIPSKPKGASNSLFAQMMADSDSD